MANIIRECENCGEPNPTVENRDHGMAECGPCWRETLRHGHAHGMHQDSDGRGEYVDECPSCEALPLYDRIAARLVQQGIAASAEHTGGGVMCILIPAGTDRKWYFGTADVCWGGALLQEEDDANGVYSNESARELQTTVSSDSTDAREIAEAIRKAVTPQWVREFGADWQVPAVIANDPALSDQSWHHDAMPIFCLVRDADRGSNEGVVRLSCDHADPQQSEFPPAPGKAYQRFSVWRDRDAAASITDHDVLYVGADAAEAVAILKREGPIVNR